MAGKTPVFTFRGTILSRDAIGMRVLNFAATMIALGFSTLAEAQDDSDTMDSRPVARGVVSIEVKPCFRNWVVQDSLYSSQLVARLVHLAGGNPEYCRPRLCF